MTAIEPQLPLDIPLTLAPRQGRPALNRSAPHALITCAQGRLVALGAILTGAFLIVALRLVDATVLQPAVAEASAPIGPGVEQPLRADITDRNGEILATSLPTQSLFADPAKLIDPVATARGLASALPDLKYEDLLDKLSSARRFVWLKRNLSPDEVYRVNALGFPGLEFQRESTRVYPAGATTVHMLGFTDVDGRGLGGIERGMEARLIDGTTPLNLSIDLRLQHLMARELQKAVTDFRAIGGTGIIMDAWTGEVLSAVSLPDFLPQQAGTAGDEARFNRFAMGSYELGSVMKMITTAAGLESGRMNLDSFYDASQPLRYGRFTINDFHAERRWLSVAEIFTYSSNIGAARMAIDMGPAFERDFFCKLGLCSTLRMELAERGDSISPAEWKELTAVTISYGHGLSVTPLHFVRAAAATVTGHLVTPTFLRREAVTGPLGPQIVSNRTVDMMRRVMRANVVIGSGKSANVEGYLVGGKTGTAEKTTGRRYNTNANFSSFLGAFPMNNPRYIVFVMLDEPQGNASTHGYRTGGWTAAPVVGRVITQMGPLYALPPQSKDNPQVRQALSLDIKSRMQRRETY